MSCPSIHRWVGHHDEARDKNNLMRKEKEVKSLYVLCTFLCLLYIYLLRSLEKYIIVLSSRVILRIMNICYTYLLHNVIGFISSDRSLGFFKNFSVCPSVHKIIEPNQTLNLNPYPLNPLTTLTTFNFFPPSYP